MLRPSFNMFFMHLPYISYICVILFYAFRFHSSKWDESQGFLLEQFKLYNYEIWTSIIRIIILLG